MPSRDVALLTPPPDVTSPPESPPAATRLVLPAALLRLTAAGEKKQQLIRCIVKVVKRSKQPAVGSSCSKRIKSADDRDSEAENKRDEEETNEPTNMISRTNLKQRLAWEQIQQQEKKNRELSTSAPSQISNAIRVPLYSSPANVQVPKQVLMVKSKLENPTPYHVRESQQRQLREYLSQSHHGFKSTSLPLSPPPMENPVEPSPTSDFSLAVSSDAASPELEEFWQDLQNFNSCSDSVAENILDPSLTVPSSEADFLKVISSILPSLDGQVSTSCPVGIPSEEDSLLMDEKIKKDRQKKDNHNKIEKRRRYKINDKISELGTLLPKSTDPYYNLVKDLRQNKGTILKASVDYVRCLKKEVKKIPDLELRCRMFENLNRKLLLRIQDLEMQLKSNNIPVNDSTWFPSTEADLNAIIKQEISTNPPGSSSPQHASSSFPDHSSFMNPLQRLPTVPEQFDDIPGIDIAASMLAPHSDPCGESRKRLPIMQFLTVKKESQQSRGSSCSQSPATCCTSPAPSYSTFDDLMMEDDLPVTGDPMLSSRDSFSPENMDFMS